ncbi:MAG TPA: hypothetical protein VGH07_07695, partial [Chthoniobacterales bacterium]
MTQIRIKPEMTKSMTTTENVSTCDSSAAVQCPTPAYAKPIFPNGSLEEKDSPTPYDSDRALIKAAEQMKFDWPEFLPEERLGIGIVEIVFGLFLFAALVAFCCLG